MAWLCLSGTNSRAKSAQTVTQDSQMCIVTGPRIELAITLIDRMQGLFRGLNPQMSFDTKENVIELNGVHIEAYPSHHLDSMRGLKDVSFIYLDEADFFPPGQQQDARDVSERYIAKCNPYIIMCRYLLTYQMAYSKGLRKNLKRVAFTDVYIWIILKGLAKSILKKRYSRRSSHLHLNVSITLSTLALLAMSSM